jgi:hypothetical protein
MSKGISHRSECLKLILKPIKKVDDDIPILSHRTSSQRRSTSVICLYSIEREKLLRLCTLQKSLNNFSPLF